MILKAIFVLTVFLAGLVTSTAQLSPGGSFPPNGHRVVPSITVSPPMSSTVMDGHPTKMMKSRTESVTCTYEIPHHHSAVISHVPNGDHYRDHPHSHSLHVGSTSDNPSSAPADTMLGSPFDDPPPPVVTASGSTSQIPEIQPFPGPFGPGPDVVARDVHRKRSIDMTSATHDHKTAAPHPHQHTSSHRPRPPPHTTQPAEKREHGTFSTPNDGHGPKTISLKASSITSERTPHDTASYRKKHTSTTRRLHGPPPIQSHVQLDHRDFTVATTTDTLTTIVTGARSAPTGISDTVSPVNSISVVPIWSTSGDSGSQTSVAPPLVTGSPPFSAASTGFQLTSSGPIQHSNTSQPSAAAGGTVTGSLPTYWPSSSTGSSYLTNSPAGVNSSGTTTASFSLLLTTVTSLKTVQPIQAPTGSNSATTMPSSAPTSNGTSSSGSALAASKMTDANILSMFALLAVGALVFALG